MHYYILIKMNYIIFWKHLWKKYYLFIIIIVIYIVFRFKDLCFLCLLPVWCCIQATSGTENSKCSSEPKLLWLVLVTHDILELSLHVIKSRFDPALHCEKCLISCTALFCCRVCCVGFINIKAVLSTSSSMSAKWWFVLMEWNNF